MSKRRSGGANAAKAKATKPAVEVNDLVKSYGDVIAL